MKRNKVYRPRRGVHFSDDLGKRPAGGFVGGSSTAHTRPTVAKKNLSLKKFSSVVTSGSVGRYTGNPNDFTHFVQNPATNTPVITTGSLSIRNSVSYGRQYTRAKYNSILLGLSASNAIDAAPYTKLVDATLTGTLASPSWTHKSVGFNQAFVGVSLSSSFVETRTRNYWRSGSAPLESSPVPASASLFYSKQSRLQTIIVKHTASALDSTIQPVTGVFVPISFSPGTGSNFTVVTGVLDQRLTPYYTNPSGPQTSSIGTAASFFVNVPVSGRLVDIKVWLECIHLSGGTGEIPPLGYFAAALRSPNVTWGHAHPIRNDPNLISVYQSSGTDYTAIPISSPVLTFLYYPPYRFYRDTFLLWEGPQNYDLAINANAPDGDGGFLRMRYPSWERDRSIRTVFSDGSPIPNPRHLLGTSVSGNWSGSPNQAVSNSPSAHGNNVPWTSDPTGLASTDPSTYTGPGSPPAGWLTGPGGAAAVNEWPTTGVNYGTQTIRPIYPMLDSLYQVKRITSELSPQTGSALSQAQFRPDLWRGFRPGLRGTEISGTWELLLASPLNGSGSVYFRQVRLEITYESPSWSKPVERAHSRRLPRRHGPMLLCTISGSDFAFATSAYPYDRAGWDWWISDTYTEVGYNAEIGRTFGLALNGGTVDATQYALLYRLSGTLAGISGSTPGWLLNNSFGMPQIPTSTSSLVQLTSSLPVSASPSSFISPVKLLDGPRRLADVADDVNPQLTLVQLAADFVSGTVT